MTDIRALIKNMAAEETVFAQTRFVAPCVRGGRVRARVSGVVQTFAPVPPDFEGWGVFAPMGARARLEGEADLMQVDAYLGLFPVLRVRLARQLQGQAWLAYPTSEADMAQRFGAPRPVIVHLVTEGATFEQATVRGNGGVFWFETTDRRADPMPAEQLRDALRAVTEPEALAFKGLAPEMRTVYDLVTQQDAAFIEARRQRELQQRRAAERAYRRDHRRRARDYEMLAATVEEELWYGAPGDAPRANENDQERLRRALTLGGGELRTANDRGDYWLVEWTTASGARHTSAIAKGDLTVVSSGICLSGRDRDFDLSSLVGVIERRGEDW
jgi:hypothetical protein